MKLHSPRQQLRCLPVTMLLFLLVEVKFPIAAGQQRPSLNPKLLGRLQCFQLILCIFYDINATSHPFIYLFQHSRCWWILGSTFSDICCSKRVCTDRLWEEADGAEGKYSCDAEVRHSHLLLFSEASAGFWHESLHSSCSSQFMNTELYVRHFVIIHPARWKFLYHHHHISSLQQMFSKW